MKTIEDLKNEKNKVQSLVFKILSEFEREFDCEVTGFKRTTVENPTSTGKSITATFELVVEI